MGLCFFSVCASQSIESHKCMLWIPEKNFEPLKKNKLDKDSGIQQTCKGRSVMKTATTSQGFNTMIRMFLRIYDLIGEKHNSVKS